MLLSRLGIGFLGSTGISKLFSRRDKKKNIVSPAQNDTLYMPSKNAKCKKKHWVSSGSS
jgi:hypothetical protein